MTSLTLALHAGVERALGRSLTWRLGRWLYLGSRRELVNDPEVNGEYALQDWLLDAGLDGVVVDVGANLGEWTLRLAGAAQARGRGSLTLHAFEPAPAQRETLIQRLAERAGAEAFTVDGRALGAQAGLTELAVHGASAGSNALVSGGVHPTGAQLVEITVATLDQVCAERGYPDLLLVKVDTEGNDFNVIRGADGLFEREAIAVLQFEYNWRWLGFGHALRHVFDRFEGGPYRLGKLTADGVEFYDRWHPELDRYTETNYVVVHPRALAAIPHWRADFDRFNAVALGALARPPAPPIGGG